LTCFAVIFRGCEAPDAGQSVVLAGALTVLIGWSQHCCHREPQVDESMSDLYFETAGDRARAPARVKHGRAQHCSELDAGRAATAPGSSRPGGSAAAIAREDGPRLLPQEYTAVHHRAPRYASLRIESASAGPTTARPSRLYPVRLLWHSGDGHVSVAVHGTKTGDASELPVGETTRLLDVYHHPHAYAGERPSVAGSVPHSRHTTIAAQG
jgi:hypothetical protein